MVSPLFRLPKRDEKDSAAIGENKDKPISVVIISHDNAPELEKHLPAFLSQKYDADYQVIVVADKSDSETDDVIKRFSNDPHLYATFMPLSSRYISRKKLAITLGIKAAKYPWVIVTDAWCTPESGEWLHSFASLIKDDSDVVLGYSHFDYSNDRGPGKNFRVFDEMMTSMQWLVSAINGRVYRGTSDNLAYRKEAFVANKGFSQSQDKKWGDDDIFVSEISNGRNTRLELLPPSFATAHFDDVPHAHSILKSRRDFTSRHVKYKSQFRTQALMSVLYYLRLAALATSIAMAYTNLAVVAAAAFIFLLTWLPTMLTTFRNCYLLRLPLLFFSTPLFIVWRPIVNVAYWIKGLFTYKNNYTSLLN